MQPINYQLDVQSPFEAMSKGYQQGLTNQAGLFALQAEAQKMKAAQQQAELQKQMQADFSQLAANPNAGAKDYAAVMTKYPQFSEQLKRPFDVLDADHKKNLLTQTNQVYAALEQGDNQVALDLVKQYADAYKNSNRPQEAAIAANLAAQIEQNPSKAKLSTASWLISQLGPEKFVENFSGWEKMPSELEKSRAEAKQKTFEAENAPEKFALEKDAKKMDQQLKILDVQIKQADSQTKRGELQATRDKIQLERDKLTDKSGEDAKLKQGAAQTAFDAASASLDTLDQILKHPNLKPDFINRRTGVGSWYQWATQIIPGSDAKGLETLVETLKSQQFLEGMKKLRASSPTGATGLGNMTEKEGAKLESSIAKLDENGDYNVFMNGLNSIKNDLKRIQQRIVAEGNLPQANEGVGNTFVMKHPTLGVVTDALINKMLSERPDATREQIIQYLKQTGGQ